MDIGKGEWYNKAKNGFVVFEEWKMQNKHKSIYRWRIKIYVLGCHLGWWSKWRCCLFMEGWQPKAYFFPLQLSIFALKYIYFILEVIILFNSWLCFIDYVIFLWMFYNSSFFCWCSIIQSSASVTHEWKYLLGAANVLGWMMIHVCWTSLRLFQWTNTETVLHHLISRLVHVASRFVCNLAYTLFMHSYTLYDYNRLHCACFLSYDSLSILSKPFINRLHWCDFSDVGIMIGESLTKQKHSSSFLCFSLTHKASIGVSVLQYVSDIP